MTILTVAQRTCAVIGLAIPDTLVSNTDDDYVRLSEIILEMSRRVSRDYDWQGLSKVATVTGDGSATAFDMPTDYDRMVEDAKVWLSALDASATRIDRLDKWLELDTQDFTGFVQAWTIYGEQIHLKPALSTGATAHYFYQSNLIFRTASGAHVSEYTADDTVFRLDEQLLVLGTIWQWRAHKGLPYAEDMANYEELKAQLIKRDRGARTINLSTPRVSGAVNFAYPFPLG